MTDRLRVAILGATGHIGRSLLHEFASRPDTEVLAYARRPENLVPDIEAFAAGRAVALPIGSFGTRDTDLVVNCTGAGDPARVRDMGADLFQVTAQVDDAIIDFVREKPERLYVNMSSGAVYGTDFARPADADSVACIAVNDTPAAAYYGIIKRHAEARHRALAPLNIIDIRVFNYISPFLNRSGRLFIVDLVNALLDGTVLATAADDPVRDYATPAALGALIDSVTARWRSMGSGVNDALDLYTRAPVGKFDLLRAVETKFGLAWRVSGDTDIVAATGAKSLYYSENRAAADWGYQPPIDSLEGVMESLSALMARRR